VELSELPNVGSVLESDLKKAGINNPTKLTSLGAEKSFKMIKNLSNPNACLNKLYAIEGAIKKIRWHNIDKKRKEELKNFYNSLEE